MHKLVEDHTFQITERSKRCCLCFLIGKTLSITKLFCVITWETRVVQEIIKTFEACCTQEEIRIAWKTDTTIMYQLLIQSYLAKHHTSIVLHQSYSSPLTALDVFCFPNLNKFKRTLFQNYRGDPGKCGQLHSRKHSNNQKILGIVPCRNYGTYSGDYLKGTVLSF